MESGHEHAEAPAAPEARAAPALAPGLNAPERVLALQRTAGNRAVGKLLGNGAGAERRLARLDQHAPYVGAWQSYLNPLNQLTRIGVGRALTPDEKTLLDGVFGNALSTAIIRIRENATIIAGAGCYRTTGNIINIPGTFDPRERPHPRGRPRLAAPEQHPVQLRRKRPERHGVGPDDPGRLAEGLRLLRHAEDRLERVERRAAGPLDRGPPPAPGGVVAQRVLELSAELTASPQDSERQLQPSHRDEGPVGEEPMKPNGDPDSAQRISDRQRAYVSEGDAMVPGQDPGNDDRRCRQDTRLGIRRASFASPGPRIDQAPVR